MTTIDRKVREMIDDVTKAMLIGKAADFSAYASLVARYRVLKEIDEFLTESRSADEPGDEPTDAEK